MASLEKDHCLFLYPLQHNGLKQMSEQEFAMATALWYRWAQHSSSSQSLVLLRFMQMQKEKRTYYRGLHSFILRQFNARVSHCLVFLSLSESALCSLTICGLGTEALTLMCVLLGSTCIYGEDNDYYYY